MKKTNEEIKSYYAKGHVVAGYLDRRFSGAGGKYIHEGEVDPIRKVVDVLSQANSALSLLDVGSGSGRLTREVAPFAHKTFGLDSSAEMLSELGKTLTLAGTLKQSAFEPIPKKYSFDVITSLRFFEHFSIEDQKRLVANFLPALQKNGVLIFASQNSWSLESLLSRLFSYGRYNYFYSDREFRALFEELGLDVVRREVAFFIPRGVFLHAQVIPGVLPLLKAIDFLGVEFLPGLCSYFVYTLRKNA